MLFQKPKILNPGTNYFLFLFYFLVVSSALSQGRLSLSNIGESINESDLSRHLHILAADSMEGRETGTQGQKRASRYIREEFLRMGLWPVDSAKEPTYMQSFKLRQHQYGEIYLAMRNQKFENKKDILFDGRSFKGLVEEIEVVFVGFGQLENYKGLDVKGKGVLVIKDPDNEYDLHHTKQVAWDQGAMVFFAVTTEEKLKLAVEYYQRLEGRQPLVFDNAIESLEESFSFIVNPMVAEAIFGKPMDYLEATARKATKKGNRELKKIRSADLSVQVNHNDRVIETGNMLGYIPGSENPEQVVVISSHYDHVGIRNGLIYPGADDNASGTSALLEIAEAYSLAFKNNIGPKKSVLFLAFTAEEKGLFGSEYYTLHPVFSHDQTVANLNMDMIGRIDEKHAEDSNYVYVIGSDKISPELHRISELTNDTFTQIQLDYTYNDEDDPNRYYYRSDHYNFAKNGVPVIFYFTGVHEDYHMPTDTADKILYSKISSIAKLVFYTSWELANGMIKLE